MSPYDYLPERYPVPIMGDVVDSESFLAICIKVVVFYLHVLQA
jgi:hypothetical protein